MSQSIALKISRRDWWTSNHRLHRMDEARRTKAVRLTAMWAAQTSLQPMQRADVLATVHTPTNRHFDAPNAWPMVKAAIDGIVDAQILPDDRSGLIPRTSFEQGPKTGIRDEFHLVITLTEPAQEDQ